jgi:hypothetical protein
LGDARRARKPALRRICEALAEGVQPNHLATEADRLFEQRGVAGQRDS